MVKHRSETSRSRTGIHGGVRRGGAAAAIGAVLVLTAGVPASQADGRSEEPDVRVTGEALVPRVGGLLQGLLGETATAPASPQPTPVPETTTLSPTAVSPTSASPAPTTLSPSPAGSAATAGTAAPAPASAPVPATAAAAPPQQPATGQPEAATGVSGSGAADAPASEQPAAGTDGSAPAGSRPTAGAADPAATTRTGVPQSVGGAARSRQAMTAQAEPSAEAAKVWLGVGLVGSAGAAGLIFTRIRRL
ncbi:hypothetical protein [Arthrobacter sp. B6]|uniref:hypothetical protein n=1 Tax=Arthrobacter sp. B6 TaxID=1570137 RepID=UPI0008295277|nr:hypothetical protein [Arthrobacter sp. B6]